MYVSIEVKQSKVDSVSCKLFATDLQKFQRVSGVLIGVYKTYDSQAKGMNNNPNYYILFSFKSFTMDLSSKCLTR